MFEFDAVKKAVRCLESESACLFSQPPRRRWQPCVTLSRACAVGQLTLCRVWAGRCTQPAAVQRDTEHTGQGRTWRWDQTVSAELFKTRKKKKTPSALSDQQQPDSYSEIRGVWLQPHFFLVHTLFSSIYSVLYKIIHVNMRFFPFLSWLQNYDHLFNLLSELSSYFPHW